jgi:hypothetical protein
MTSYAYYKADYVEGIKVKEFRSQSIEQPKTVKGTIKSLSEPEYVGSWFGALLHCIGKYITAVPKRIGSTNGWECYGPGNSINNEGSPELTIEQEIISGPIVYIDLNILFPEIYPPNTPPVYVSAIDWADFIGGGSSNNSASILSNEQQKTDYLVYELNLDQTQLFYLANTQDAINTIFDYLYNNNTIRSKDIAIWAISYFRDNQFINMEVFKNQFLGTSEGTDGEFDPYWDDPNLVFTPQDLPSWDDFNAAFPKDKDPRYDTPKKMFDSIGGDVATFYTSPKTNTCAIRLSKALNYSGVVIPNIPGQTFKGADNKYYFKAAYEINLWMRKTFGTNPATATTPLNNNHFSYSQTDAGVKGVNLPRLLIGKKGIYSIYSSDFGWASGHADLLYPNSTCGNKCHFADAPIERLDIWILN